ncbi:hypothetical protein DSO57_1004414 [Entomophthora muscae]|uniref:Uncharacterized protein n=1 Tax=Entomophthora muscae TaxID=34485 RepID=A0ACC2TK28_9FUNG|nr:hypothetical protein DSO57_1004414 [Entomophthora muscae]
MQQLGEAVGMVYKDFVLDKQDVSIRSTDSRRCMASAVAFMAGFLPQERDYEIITFPKELDDLLYHYLDCPRQKRDSQAIDKSIKETALKEYIYKLHPELQEWVFPNQGFELSVRTDLIKSQYCHGKDIQNIAAIFSACNANYRHIFFDNIPTRLHRMRIGNILLNVKQDILSPPTKFKLYSAHDATLAALLSALSIRNTRAPPYAANLLIELWAPSTEEKGALRLRFIYNGQQVTPAWCHIHCSVAAFLDYMDTHLNLVGGFETYLHPPPAPFNLTQECQIPADQTLE